MKIGIIGSGYVGLVTGACFASAGLDVTIHDKDNSKINKLNKGKVPFFEPGLEDLVTTGIQRKNLRFTSSFKNLLKVSSIIFVCVGTPQRKNGSPNLSFIDNVLEEICIFYENAKDKSDKIVFIKSTVPPNTTNRFNRKLEIRGIYNVLCASNPEFLREGSAVFDFFSPDRIIVGSEDKRVRRSALDLYLKITKKKNIIFTSPQSSELIKYASNAFLATKISFINELSRLADSIDADISEVSRGVGHDKRIGNSFLNAGIGYGGSCFPKDSLALSYVYKKNNLDAKLIDAVIQINHTQKEFFLNKIFSVFKKNQLAEMEILLWGTAFKPNTDDIRESVGIKIAKHLSKLVKKINIYEPVALKNSKLALANLSNISFITEPTRNIAKNNFLVICTEYNEFNTVSLEKLRLLKEKVIFDGRNILSRDKVLASDIKYYGIGR